MALRTSATTAPPVAVVTGIAAAGTAQADATPLPLRSGLVEVATVASTAGVLLPVIRIPSEIIVRNAGATTLLVYPQSGGTIDGGPANAALSVPAGNSALLWASSASNWYSLSLPSADGTGSVTSVSVVSANGFAGSVATATTTPAITLTTSVTGLLKGNGTAVSA